MSFRLSSLAEADLDDIRAFTLERWGRDQWQAYYRDLALAFERLAENPAVGRRRDVLRPGLRSLPCGSHVIFYRLLPGGVVGIARILHYRQSAEALRAADEGSG
jgi:toxin ParE1/3/4